MGEEGQKISFGFSKLKKSTNLVKPMDVGKEKVQFVDAFDGKKGKFSFKGNVQNDGVKKVLVIPLAGTRTAYDVIKDKLDRSKDENGVKLKEEPSEETSVEAQAVKEILRDLKQEEAEKESLSNLVIPQSGAAKPTFEGEKESTLDDYDSVPVADYGLAMLRGMGWKPDKGIGKNERVVTAVTAKLRPKGLGLGADQAQIQATVQGAAAKGEELNLGVGSYIKVTSGPHKGAYGQVAGVDGDCGRMIVKIAMGGTLSLPEIILTPIPEREYEKNSKVLNAVKYEEYIAAEQEAKDTRKEASRKRKSESGEGSEDGRRQEHRRKQKSRSKKSERDEESEEDRERKHRKKISKKRKSESRDSEDDKQRKHRRKEISNKRKSESEADSENDRQRKHRRRDEETSSASSNHEKERKKRKKKKKDKSRSHSRDRKYKKKKKKKRGSSSEREVDNRGTKDNRKRRSEERESKHHRKSGKERESRRRSSSEEPRPKISRRHR